MAIPQRTATTGTSFITTITYNRRRLFQVPANAKVFLETLQHYRTQGAYKLHAFVVMPDHVHLLLTPTEKTISQVMNLIKGGFSRRLPYNSPIWQRGFADHLVRDAAQFKSRREYIHQNPVRANLVTAPDLYPFSSAYHPRASNLERVENGTKCLIH
jgi:putative transposase